jgi:uncharacterized protein (TIGR03790 family)
MKGFSHALLSLALFCVLVPSAWAGGSGLNVIVVVNQNSTNSVQLGNYYAERRQIPPQNYLRINWTGGNVEWTDADFATYLYNPFASMLSSRQLTNQIDYVVLSMDIPYTVTSGANRPNSTTSAMFYGFKLDASGPNDCAIASGSTNLYAGSEGVFRSTPPISVNSNSFLVAMITQSNLALAKLVVDSGVLSDATFPTQTVYLAKSSDTNRNVRFTTFDNAIFNTRLRGNYSMQRTNTDSNWIFGNCLGLQQGVQREASLPGTTFVPGSMADDLTSYSGTIFQPSIDHLKILQYLFFGAAGGYGTVSEPCNFLEKFPSPQNYFYQSRGFSLGECYYQSVTNPYQGLIMGEPLAAPFAVPATANWIGLSSNSVLSGTTNLSLQATAMDATRPVQQVDLFLDGLWFQTLTNIVPTRSNLLSVKINGQSANYLVPLNATIKSVAAGLTAALNGVSGATKVTAFTHGDRLELQSSDRTKPGAQVSISVSNSIGAGTAATTWITASRTNCLDTIAQGLRNFQITAPATPDTNSFLQLTVTKTNGAQFAFGVTNASGDLTLIQMAPQLLNLVNSSADLMGLDGLNGQDLIGYSPPTLPFQYAEFNLLANGVGWNAAQIQVNLITSFTNYTPGTLHLDANLPDLQPRDHLYITAGLTNLPLTFPFNTSALPNGSHELAAVVYEGSHVRTQKRVAQNIVIQNSPLSATFTSLITNTTVAREAILQFSVVANTNNISDIELFSTGGSLGFVTGQSSAMFSVAATNLDLGLHPFYALVTASNGKQYQTETKWLRILGADLPFSLSFSTPPPKLTWLATPGRSYDVLSSTSLINGFLLRDTVVPTNPIAQWTDTNTGALQRFYRVRTSN